RTLVLFPDTFTSYFEPEVGLAAAELLGRSGWTVSLGPRALQCCGRPLISTGQLDRGVQHVRQNVALLHPHAAAGHVLTACEPSCLLTLKDDYPALLRGEEQRRAAVVAEHCRTLEEV